MSWPSVVFGSRYRALTSAKAASITFRRCSPADRNALSISEATCCTSGRSIDVTSNSSWTVAGCPLIPTVNGHRVAVVDTALDVGEGLEPHKPLSHVSKLYRGPINVGVHPILGRFIGDHACHAFHVGIGAKELDKAHDESFHPVVTAEFSDVLGPCS